MKKILWVMLVLFLSACVADKKPIGPLVGTDITGADFAKDFSLQDHHGQKRQLKDYLGKTVVMFLVIRIAQMFVRRRWRIWQKR